eukprot:RCo011521
MDAKLSRIGELYELQEAILKQAEAYFSDENLGKDPKLWALLEASGSGCVALSALATFPELARLTSDPVVLEAALTQSTTLTLCQHPLTGEVSVRRSHSQALPQPLPAAPVGAISSPKKPPQGRSFGPYSMASSASSALAAATHGTVSALTRRLWTS